MIDLTERLHSAAPPPSRPIDLDAIRHGAHRRTRRRHLAVGGSALAVLVVLVAGIVAVQQRTHDEELDVGVTNPLDGVPEDSWLRLAALVPRTDEVLDYPISIADPARARAQLGIEPLPPGADDATIGNHFEALGMPTVPGYPFQASPSELRAELGFGHDEIDQRISAGTPPNEVFVAKGRFDPSRIATAVADDPLWGPRLEVKIHRGVEYYSWGEELRIEPGMGMSTPARPLGQAARLILGEGWLAWVRTDAAVRGVIDAHLDPSTSLAANETVRAMIETFDRTRVASGAFLPFSGEAESETAWPGEPYFDEPTAAALGSPGPVPGPTVLGMLYPTDADFDRTVELVVERLEGAGLHDVIQVTRSGPWLVVISSPDAGDLIGALFSFVGSGGAVVPALRPALPEVRPTSAEILADGVVTAEEYEMAFWTFVECAEAVGAQLAGITRDDTGRFYYQWGGEEEAPGCHATHLADVEREWQLANE
jgi:hypothetical protein